MESTLEADPGDRVEPVPAFAPGTIIAHFKIVRELGAGGMGIVFEAHDPDLDRRVAIKVVRDRRAGSAAGERLIAEAQAMARLAHPNVVGVHEVGTLDNQVYVVMELVRGDTLAGWIDRHPRPWRDIVHVFLQAGKGLLAAHHAGLIHRDFKPSNVLIDTSGRARVSDFGLARSEDRAEQIAEGSDNSGIAGTLAYMAPEQRFGEDVDARADQYSFAISLQKALAPKHAVGAPSRRVKNAIARALSIDPDERFPTMDALLAELERGVESRRRIFVTLGTGVVLAGMTATLFATRAAADTCADGASLVDEVWNPGTRTAQLATFLRARPSGMLLGSKTLHLVDDWADRWKLGRKAACTLDGPQRVAHLGCLDRGLNELRAQIALWREGDPIVVDHAVQAAADLPGPQSCTAEPAGNLPFQLRAIGAKLSALRRSGRATLAAQEVPLLLQLAEAVKMPRALAIALLEAARIERDAGNLTTAREYYSRGAQEAGRSGDDAVLLDAILEESNVIVDLGRPRDSLGLLDAAAALKVRAKLDDENRIALARADALGQAGRSKEAIEVTMQVLPEVEARAFRDPSRRTQLSTALGQLAAAQIARDDNEGAIKTLGRALDIDVGTYGPSHPEVAKTLHDLATAEIDSERYADARKHIDRALSIFVAFYGEHHPMVGATYLSYAQLAASTNKLDEAVVSYEKARAALVGKVPPDAPHFVVIESGLGEVLRYQGKCAEALPHLQRALQLLDQNGQQENQHALQLTNLGFCLHDTGRDKEGRAAIERSLDEISHLDMAKRWRSEPLAVLAEIEHAAGHRAKAIELVKQALVALEGEQGSDVVELRKDEQERLRLWARH